MVQILEKTKIYLEVTGLSYSALRICSLLTTTKNRIFYENKLNENITKEKIYMNGYFLLDFLVRFNGINISFPPKLIYMLNSVQIKIFPECINNLKVLL